MIPVYVGYDNREAIAYHTFCQSVLSRATSPVSFAPLVLNAMNKIYKEAHTDGSNSFIYSRFLVPHLQGYQGWAIFADGDMTCHDDIAKLWEMRDPSKAVMVVKHDYKTKFSKKYLGNDNADYPRKNWSSVILWNCEHRANRLLTPAFIENATGAQLHRFTWLTDEQIGELPIEWNWLDSEYEVNENAKLIHYTIGTPCFSGYQESGQANRWLGEYFQSIYPLKGRGLESYV
jgi:lipopolysaccharide biosynthesis glycosyltransferase